VHFKPLAVQMEIFSVEKGGEGMWLKVLQTSKIALL
jgi:hypothetical protein